MSNVHDCACQPRNFKTLAAMRKAQWYLGTLWLQNGASDSDLTPLALRAATQNGQNLFRNFRKVLEKLLVKVPKCSVDPAAAAPAEFVKFNNPAAVTPAELKKSPTGSVTSS